MPIIKLAIIRNINRLLTQIKEPQIENLPDLVMTEQHFSPLTDFYLLCTLD